MKTKIESYKIEESILYKKNLIIHRKLLYVYSISIGVGVLFILANIYL